MTVIDFFCTDCRDVPNLGRKRQVQANTGFAKGLFQGTELDARALQVQ